jgi:tRNA threonylcarbamoyladenosine biosynthesis protein TsaE
MERKEFTSTSPSETRDIGADIAKGAVKGDVFALYGELGAGKTQLVKGIARALGVEDWEYVASPSYTIVNAYEGSIALYHVDLYRIEEGGAEEFHIEELADQGVVAAEWAERMMWWDGITKVYIDVVGDTIRKVTVERP